MYIKTFATIAFYVNALQKYFRSRDYADISKGLRLHHKVKQKMRGVLDAS